VEDENETDSIEISEENINEKKDRFITILQKYLKINLNVIFVIKI